MTDAIQEAPPPRSAPEVKAMLESTEKGGVRNSIQNCLTVFQHDPVLSGALAKNLLTERIDLLRPIGRKHRPGSRTLTDTDMKYIRLYLEKTYGLTSEKKIADAADLAADANRYHPIRDYLNGLTWDRTERIRFCLRHFLGADSDQYTYEALRLFLLGAIHRAFCPGCKFEVMLCLVGGQGAGKSTFFRLLAVKDEWFSDDLRKLDDDNVYRKLQGHWIIEMSEMIATANAKSIEEIKSFLSRQKEVYKIPYETHPEDRLRQCVFGGTSNALDFLPLDRSGNRRFLPVMVNPEEAEVHILDDEAASRAYIEQVWAEAMTIYRSGDFKLSFSPEMVRYLKEHQRDFMPEDTKAGMIQAYLDRYTGSAVCSKQLFKEALNHPFDEPKQWEIREVNDIMFFKWVFKTYAAVLIVTNTWNIVMGVFDAAQQVVNQSAGVIIGNTSIDIDSLVGDLQTSLEAMSLGGLIGLWFQSLFVGLTMNILSICIMLVVYGRMIEIYLVTSLGPIPLATMTNGEWRNVGQNYLKSLLALGFQAFLIMVVVGIYSVLIQSISATGDVSGAIWLAMGYTVLLCFCLFKTGSMAKAVFSAH